MVVASLLFVVAAVVLLILGLVGASNTYLIGSIAASLLAVVALIVSGRQNAARRAAEEQAAAQARAGRRSAGQSPPARLPVDRAGTAQVPVDRLAADRAAVDRLPVDRAAADLLPVDRLPRGGARVNGAGLPGGAEAPGRAVGDHPGDGTAVELPSPRGGRGRHGAMLRTAVYPGYDDEGGPADEPAVQLTSAGDSARVARLGTEVYVVDGRPRYHLGGCDHLEGRRVTAVAAREAVELGFTPCALCEPDTELLAPLRRES